MRALCMITVGAGQVDSVRRSLKRRRRMVKEAMTVTGRADVCVVLQGSIDEINTAVIEFKRIKGITTTETLMEVEVDMGW